MSRCRFRCTRPEANTRGPVPASISDARSTFYLVDSVKHTIDSARNDTELFGYSGLLISVRLAHRRTIVKDFPLPV